MMLSLQLHASLTSLPIFFTTAGPRTGHHEKVSEQHRNPNAKPAASPLTFPSPSLTER